VRMSGCLSLCFDESVASNRPRMEGVMRPLWPKVGGSAVVCTAANKQHTLPCPTDDTNDTGRASFSWQASHRMAAPCQPSCASSSMEANQESPHQCSHRCQAPALQCRPARGCPGTAATAPAAGRAAGQGRGAGMQGTAGSGKVLVRRGGTKKASRADSRALTPDTVARQLPVQSSKLPHGQSTH